MDVREKGRPRERKEVGAIVAVRIEYNHAYRLVGLLHSGRRVAAF